MKRLILLSLLCILSFLSFAQDSIGVSIPADYLTQVNHKVDALKDKLDKQSLKALQQFQKTEEKLQKKLIRLDSTKAGQVFSSAKEKYNSIEQKLQQPAKLTEYIPALDTLKTSLAFLSQNKGLLSDAKDIDGKLNGSLSKVKELESSLGGAETVQQFIQERKAYLKEQLQGLPFTKELTKLNKQAYYYHAQIAEYKAALKDQKKLERKALELLSKTKLFQDFMRKHSQLASLFRIPGSNDVTNAASLQGLQTRAQMNQLLQDRFGNNSASIAQLKENVNAAQGQLNSLKSKVENLPSGSIGNSSEDLEQPNFRPNNQKTKSFLKRLELGTNIQSQKAQWMFPITSDIGFSIGYQLNDKSSIGVGGSYKLGLGTGWSHMKLSHQGIGLRSFIDYQLKGSFFINGGYEQNYRTQIKSVTQLKDRSAWQSSGLIGLTKKYRVSNKFRGNMQLLWDFLSYEQIPKSQPILFRIGYSLK